MKKNYFRKPIWHLSIFIIMVVLFSLAVMLLWNWLMTTIFGLTAINYLQALGLLILTRILFGSFPRNWSRHRPHPQDNPMFDKWTKMSSEERAEFVKKRKERWTKMNDEGKEAFLHKRRHSFEPPFDAPEHSEK